MSEEIKKNAQDVELSPEDLEKIAGGLVVDCGSLRYKRVVDEKTGEVIGNIWHTKDAQKLAERNGLSTEVITMEEYKKRFGHDLKL